MTPPKRSAFGRRESTRRTHQNRRASAEDSFAHGHSIHSFYDLYSVTPTSCRFAQPVVLALRQRNQRIGHSAAVPLALRDKLLDGGNRAYFVSLHATSRHRPSGPQIHAGPFLRRPQVRVFSKPFTFGVLLRGRVSLCGRQQRPPRGMPPRVEGIVVIIGFCPAVRLAYWRRRRHYPGGEENNVPQTGNFACARLQLT